MYHHARTFLSCLFVYLTGLSADYTKPVTNFRQLINGDKHGFWGNFIFDSNNTIQLSWDHVHFYHGYELYWWTNINGLKGQIYIDPTVLEPSRLYEVEYYSFTEYSNNYVYYFKLQGWLYGRGYGEMSKVLKALKPYVGQLFPVENIRQLYNGDKTAIHIDWKQQLSRLTYAIDFCPKYRCNSDENTKSKIVHAVNETFIGGLEHILYKITVYQVIQYNQSLGLSSDQIAKINLFSKIQASSVILKAGFIGQPSAVQGLEQLKSQSNQSITLRFNMLTHGQNGDAKVLGYKVKVYLNSTLLRSGDCQRDHETHFWVYCFVGDVPPSTTLDVSVYGYNRFGDGNRRLLIAQVNQSIFTDLPKQVKDLIVSSNTKDETSIKLQWEKITIHDAGLNVGFFHIKSYKVVLSSNENNWEKEIGIRNWYILNSTPKGERYVETTFSDLEKDRSYTVSVCVMTRRMGCGPPSYLHNIRTNYSIDMSALRILSVAQLPELRFDHLKLEWRMEEEEGLLPLVGVLFSLECERAFNRPRHFKKFDVLLKDINRVDEMTFEHSFSFECHHLAGGSIVFVKYRSYNQYRFSEWSPVIEVKTQFKNLSKPRDLHLERCTDRVVLTWSQIAEPLDGYCVNYRSLSDRISTERQFDSSNVSWRTNGGWTAEDTNAHRPSQGNYSSALLHTTNTEQDITNKLYMLGVVLSRKQPRQLKDRKRRTSHLSHLPSCWPHLLCFYLSL
uniref:Fibronectin type-III domain-containing protein n=1 Tax=Clytia hemisphaerica TaxID=252671 RepID=A0A7M6DPL8_9CNID